MMWLRKGGATMNIGTKIKKARMDAGLSQEQVAEELGVSRQTVSNWETDKTYPDIISVIKMSDIYDVSLDYLLKGKEEATMNNYMEYLEESTNTVKSKNKLSKVVLVATYLAVWTFSLVMFWFFMSASDTMGFGLVFLWIIIPVTTFVLSVVIGRNDYWGKGKWLVALALGIMYMLAEYATFSAANMVAFDKLNMPSVGMLVAGTVIAAMGIGIGMAVRHKTSK